MSEPTAAQLDYIESLTRRAGASLSEVKAQLQLDEPITVEGASKIIDALKDRLGIVGSETRPPKRGQGRAEDSGRLGATELRAIAEGRRPAPTDLAVDESWILFRLAKLIDLELAIGEPARWAGANQGEQIRVEHLEAYFGSVEAVATAFGVSVGTVRSGWGGVLPPNRVFEAVVKTRGYVQAPH
ncbi:Cro/CI family transcriptional regulator [Luteimonas sp. MHLX1A]|uniref:Cro/CI family transcriptional regulator n=1 Tax=Alterluteimonas muca TaxID=2878684 RepID=UPI001E2D3545|nr:Cro/CI family transcriptional regulator [Luteimonas sp. MHLX1A]MCD9046742.1 Cro/CI family transcriptional regulator [Luteimonas sp. MHLX1A]